jgi:hypothetical protein
MENVKLKNTVAQDGFVRLVMLDHVTLVENGLMFVPVMDKRNLIGFK